MNAKSPTMNEYLKTKVLTASPEELQLMLYDGGIRFCEQARIAVKNKEIENSYNLIVRAENILMELTSSMKDELAPETCSNMRRLYIYCYEQLIEANIKKELEPLDNTLKVLRHLRETWILLMEKLIEERSENPDEPNAVSHMQPENPPDIEVLLNQQVGATLNVEG